MDGPIASASHTTAAAALRATGIGKRFGAVRALDGVTLDVERGEFLTLLGPSGSGKTTFLMILAGFTAPDAGRLLLDGADITGLPAEARSFGMVFQGYALFPHLSVAANIAFPLRVRKVPAAERRRRVAEMIARVGLEGQARKLPAQLSGGQQQRVALARALAFAPKLLLLDEPFSALDKGLRGQMQDEVRRLHRDTGATFVFVTHDQSEALALSSRIAIFDHGRLLQLGRPRDVYERPGSRFVAEFLGELNRLPLAGIGWAEGVARGRFEDRTLSVSGTDISASSAILGVRPEHMSLLPACPEGDANAIAAVVHDATYLGATTRLSLRTAGGAALTLTVPTRPGPDMTGAPVWLGWAAEHGVLLPADQ